MSKCLIGREVVVAIRPKRSKGSADIYSVVCPARWTRSQFLRYARGEHPKDTVRIVDWKDSGGWEPRLWIANPQGFVNYAAGRMEEV